MDGAKSKLGLWTSTSLVVGNMIGSGVFLLPTALASFGGISLFGWLFSALGAGLLALVFSHLSRLMPKAGGPYAYTRAGFGDFAGFLVAWGYWISVWCGNAAITVALVSYLSVFIPALATNNLLAIAVGLVAIWGLTWVNILRSKNRRQSAVSDNYFKIDPSYSDRDRWIFFYQPGAF